MSIHPILERIQKSEHDLSVDRIKIKLESKTFLQREKERQEMEDKFQAMRQMLIDGNIQGAIELGSKK